MYIKVYRYVIILQWNNACGVAITRRMFSQIATKDTPYHSHCKPWRCPCEYIFLFISWFRQCCITQHWKTHHKFLVVYESAFESLNLWTGSVLKMITFRLVGTKPFPKIVIDSFAKTCSMRFDIFLCFNACKCCYNYHFLGYHTDDTAVVY